MSEKKCVRLVFEYDDGEIRTLRGEDAAKHYAWMDSACLLASMHSMPGYEVTWEVTERVPRCHRCNDTGEYMGDPCTCRSGQPWPK